MARKVTQEYSWSDIYKGTKRIRVDYVMFSYNIIRSPILV